MQRFKTLSDFLTPDYHTDYWSDDAVLIAMVASEDETVAKTAAASLRPYRDRLEPVMVPDPIKDRIRAIAGTSHLMQLALGNLVKKIEREKP